MKIYPKEESEEGDQLLSSSSDHLMTRISIIKWAIIIILSLPCLFIIKTLIGDSRIPNADHPFSMEASDTYTDMFISGFSIVSNIVAIGAVYISSQFCSQVYKTMLLKMFQKKDPMKLEYLSLLHNSLNSGNPTEVLFAVSRKDYSGYLVFLVLLLTSVVNIYSSIIPLGITRYHDSINEKSEHTNIPIPAISDNGFGTSSPFDSTGRPTLGFLTVFYYSQIVMQNNIFGQSLHNGSLPLTTFPFQSDDTNIIRLESTPLISFNITDWTYKIVPKTANFSGYDAFGKWYSLDIFDAWNTSAIQDGSSFSFDDNAMFECFLNQPAPWNNCVVPDSMAFTLVQKLPRLYESSNISSLVFYLPRANIPGYPSITPIDNQTAYVLKGNLSFRKSLVEGRRDFATGIWSLSQTYLGMEEFTSEFEMTTPMRDFTLQEDLLYKKLKIAVARLLARSFATQSAVSDRPQFTWNQLREIISLDRLDASQSGYSQQQYVNELLRRLVLVTGNWINIMGSMGDTNNNNPDSFLTIRYVTGRIVRKISVSFPVLFAVAFMVLWVILVVAIVPTTLIIKRTRLERSAAQKGPENQKLETAIRKISGAPHGIAALINRAQDHSKKLVFQEIQDDQLILTCVEKENPISASSLIMNSGEV